MPVAGVYDWALRLRTLVVFCILFKFHHGWGENVAFQYVDLTPEESARFRQRVRGPVLGFAQACAIDREEGAVLIELGGKPDLEPERGEPPGHYNLLWNDFAITAAGYYKFEQRAGQYVLVHLSLIHISEPTRPY